MVTFQGTKIVMSSLKLLFFSSYLDLSRRASHVRYNKHVKFIYTVNGWTWLPISNPNLPCARSSHVTQIAKSASNSDC